MLDKELDQHLDNLNRGILFETIEEREKRIKKEKEKNVEECKRYCENRNELMFIATNSHRYNVELMIDPLFNVKVKESGTFPSDFSFIKRLFTIQLQSFLKEGETIFISIPDIISVFFILRLGLDIENKNYFDRKFPSIVEYFNEYIKYNEEDERYIEIYTSLWLKQKPKQDFEKI